MALEVTGNGPMDISRKTTALKKLNNLSAEDLEKLAQLAESKNALNYLQKKWFILKSFLKI